MNLLDRLRSSWLRKNLEGKLVHYRVRWAPGEERQGTISRMKDSTLFIGCFCFHHDDIVALSKVQ